MDEILNTLSSPVWWITVVVAGIIINVLSALVIKRADSILSKMSTRWRNRSEREAKLRLERIKLLIEYPSERKKAEIATMSSFIFTLLFISTPMLMLLMLYFFESIPSSSSVTKTTITLLLRVFLLFVSAICIMMSSRSLSASTQSRTELFESLDAITDKEIRELRQSDSSNPARGTLNSVGTSKARGKSKPQKGSD